MANLGSSLSLMLLCQRQQQQQPRWLADQPRQQRKRDCHASFKRGRTRSRSADCRLKSSASQVVSNQNSAAALASAKIAEGEKRNRVTLIRFDPDKTDPDDPDSHPEPASASMACLNVLKHEIRTLESTFPRSHPRLQIVSASVDELTCKFIDAQGKKHVIHANITVSIGLLGPPAPRSLRKKAGLAGASMTYLSTINHHFPDRRLIPRPHPFGSRSPKTPQ